MDYNTLYSIGIRQEDRENAEKSLELFFKRKKLKILEDFEKDPSRGLSGFFKGPTN